MGLMDEFRTEPKPVKRSALDDVVDIMSPEERAEFLDALHDETIPATVITRVMQRHGYGIHFRMITGYRANMAHFRYTKDGIRVAQ